MIQRSKVIVVCRACPELRKEPYSMLYSVIRVAVYTWLFGAYIFQTVVFLHFTTGVNN